MDRAKEGLFNILSNRLELDGLRAVDLFAGSGAIAFEFASRGASQVLCVESNALHAREIVRNARELGLSQVHVLRMPVQRYFRQCSPFEVVFADPPYAIPEMPSLPLQIIQSGLLPRGGLLILEHAPQQQFEAVAPEFSRHYGDAEFSFFRALP